MRERRSSLTSTSCACSMPTAMSSPKATMCRRWCPTTGRARRGSDTGYDRQLVLDISYEDNVYGRSQAQSLLFSPLSLLNKLRRTEPHLLSQGQVVNVRINDGWDHYPTDVPNWAKACSGRLLPGQQDCGDLGDGPEPVGNVYALAPAMHRDFPIDVLASDQTYTIEAWAVNEDREVISPKATLKVHPRELPPTTLGSGAARFQPYSDGYLEGSLFECHVRYLADHRVHGAQVGSGTTVGGPKVASAANLEPGRGRFHVLGMPA